MSLFVLNEFEIELLFFVLFKFDAFTIAVFNKSSLVLRKLITTPHVLLSIHYPRNALNTITLHEIFLPIKLN